MSQTKGASLKKKSANDPLLDSVAPDKSNLSFIVIFLVIQAQKYGVGPGGLDSYPFPKKGKSDRIENIYRTSAKCLLGTIKSLATFGDPPNE